MFSGSGHSGPEPARSIHPSDFELLLEIVSRLFGHIGIPLSMYASKRASGDLIRIDEVEDAVQPYGAVRKIVRPGTVLRMRAEGRAARMERGSIGQGVVGIGWDRVESGFGVGINDNPHLPAFCVKELHQVHAPACGLHVIFFTRKDSCRCVKSGRCHGKFQVAIRRKCEECTEGRGVLRGKSVPRLHGVGENRRGGHTVYEAEQGDSLVVDSWVLGEKS